MSERLEIAREGWGETPPDWILALVAACDGSSQNKVAGRLGLSAATVSQTLRREYRGDMARIEDRVRSILLGDAVTCPALGEVSAETCLRWRDLSPTLTSASPMRVRMFNACNGCSRNRRAAEEMT